MCIFVSRKQRTKIIGIWHKDFLNQSHLLRADSTAM